MTSRRTFIATIPVGIAAVAASRLAVAEPVRVPEDDPAAAAIGYRHNAAEVDVEKFPRYQAGQNCANCALYQGAADAEWAPCAVLGNRLVAGAGWCVAWVPRPA
jgi:hypothetical protein